MSDEIRRKEIAVINPKPRVIVTYKGQEFPVLSITNLPYRRMLQILDPEVPEDETLGQTVDRIKRQILDVCPTATAADLEPMTYQELLNFLAAATEVDTEAGPTEAPPAAGASSTT